jgi:hypothetical protein
MTDEVCVVVIHRLDAVFVELRLPDDAVVDKQMAGR